MNTIKIENIVVGERVRQASKGAVESLANSIRSEGLLNPILLRDIGGGKGRLVAGLHRLEAVKSLGGTEIAYHFLKTHGHAELDDIREGIAECTENLQRSDLVEEAMRAPFTVRMAELAAKRRTILTQQDADAAFEQAKSSKDPKKIKAAREAKRRADEAHDTVNASGDAFPVSRLPNNVRQEIAREAGLHPQTITADLTLARTHGLEVLALATNLELAGPKEKYNSKAELAALAKLKIEHPQKHAIVIEGWKQAVAGKKGMAQRPSSVLAEIGKRAASDKRKEARETAEGAIAAILEAVGVCKSKLVDIVPCLPVAAKAGNLRDMPQKLRSIRDDLEAYRSLLVTIRSGLKNN